MKEVKEKKIIKPNESSILRWLVALVVGCGVGFIACFPFEGFIKNTTDKFMGIPYASIFSVLTFIPVFVGVVLAIRFIAKTSMKDFILGVGGSINIKNCLVILGVFLLGFVLASLMVINNIYPRTVDGGQYAFLFGFMLLTTWMQTTLEELIFRGVFIRWACKNNVSITKKIYYCRYCKLAPVWYLSHS